MATPGVAKISFSEAEATTISVKLPRKIPQKTKEVPDTKPELLKETGEKYSSKLNGIRLHSTLKSKEAYLAVLGAGKVPMSRKEFGTLTWGREGETMVLTNFAILDAHRKEIPLGNVPYANEITIRHFEGRRLPPGLHRVELTQKDHKTLVFFLESKDLARVKGAPGVVIK